jgi:urea transport system ATP-binding protein
VSAGAESILEVDRVTVSFDGFKALDDLSLSIARGELRFLIGPNGAGKTTLLDIVTGKTRPASGRVTFDGRVNMLGRSEHEIVRQGVARKFQAPSIFASLTVRENIEAAASFRERTISLFRSPAAEVRDAIESTLDQVGLKTRASMQAGRLSHGEKQWLEIGMLLVQRPKLLLLDEPVAGMTRAERERTGELLRALCEGRSVVVVEHDMDFVRRFATTVTVLHAGRVLCEGTVDAVQGDPRVIEVYLGKPHEGRRARAHAALAAGA